MDRRVEIHYLIQDSKARLGYQTARMIERVDLIHHDGDSVSTVYEAKLGLVDNDIKVHDNPFFMQLQQTLERYLLVCMMLQF